MASLSCPNCGTTAPTRGTLCDLCRNPNRSFPLNYAIELFINGASVAEISRLLGRNATKVANSLYGVPGLVVMMNVNLNNRDGRKPYQYLEWPSLPKNKVPVVKATAAALRAERERALEEAAKVCRERADQLTIEAETYQRKSYEWQWLMDDADLADSLADTILALKETQS